MHIKATQRITTYQSDCKYLKTFYLHSDLICKYLST